jgi:hypothetical protein
MLNEDGEYVEIEEQDWQTAWNERLTKAKGMTPEEVFMAARGAGNTSLKKDPRVTRPRNDEPWRGVEMQLS